MGLTSEEREQVKARIGEMIAGEPITDAEYIDSQLYE